MGIFVPDNLLLWSGDRGDDRVTSFD